MTRFLVVNLIGIALYMVSGAVWRALNLDASGAAICTWAFGCTAGWIGSELLGVRR